MGNIRKGIADLMCWYPSNDEEEDGSPTPAPGNARTGCRPGSRETATASASAPAQGRTRNRTSTYYDGPSASSARGSGSGLFDLMAPLSKLSNARNAAIQVQRAEPTLERAATR